MARGKYRLKKKKKPSKFGYPDLISMKKFINWMPAGDLRMGSYLPGGRLSPGAS